MRILYHTPLWPACLAVRMLLREKELPHDLMQEQPWEGRAEFMALHPSCAVPLLVEENGDVVAGQYAITEYLEETYGDAQDRHFFGTTPLMRAQVRAIIDWFSCRFDAEVSKPLLSEKIFKRLMRQGGPNSDAIRGGKKSIGYHMEYVTYLTHGHPYLAGDALSMADMVAAAHVAAVDYLGEIDWEPYPKAKEWYALIKSRPSLRMILSDRIALCRPPEHYENPDF